MDLNLDPPEDDNFTGIDLNLVLTLLDDNEAMDGGINLDFQAPLDDAVGNFLRLSL